MVTLIGMYYGAKKFNLIKTIIKYSLKCSIIISYIYFFIFYFFANKIIPIFVNDDSIEVINIGTQYFKIFAFAVPFIAISMIGARVMQGIGKHILCLLLPALRVIIISCSLAWYFLKILNKPIEYAWYSILISCIFSALISISWMFLEIKK